jgi:hypothetical protein
MRALLEAEGVVFDAHERVDLKRYGWDPLRDLDAADRERLLAEADAHPTEPDDELMRLLTDDPASPFRVVRPPL